MREPFTIADEVGVGACLLTQPRWNATNKQFVAPEALVVRFRHLHPFAERSRANAGIKGTTSKFMNLVELLNLTFECELAAAGTQMSNSLH